MQACLVTLKLAITCRGTRSPLGQPIPKAERDTKNIAQNNKKKLTLALRSIWENKSISVTHISQSSFHKINVWILEKAKELEPRQAVGLERL